MGFRCAIAEIGIYGHTHWHTEAGPDGKTLAAGFTGSSGSPGHVEGWSAPGFEDT